MVSKLHMVNAPSAISFGNDSRRILSGSIEMSTEPNIVGS